MREWLYRELEAELADEQDEREREEDEQDPYDEVDTHWSNRP